MSTESQSATAGFGPVLFSEASRDVNLEGLSRRGWRAAASVLRHASASAADAAPGTFRPARRVPTRRVPEAVGASMTDARATAAFPRSIRRWVAAPDRARPPGRVAALAAAPFRCRAPLASPRPRRVLRTVSCGSPTARPRPRAWAGCSPRTNTPRHHPVRDITKQCTPRNSAINAATARKRSSRERCASY